MVLEPNTRYPACSTLKRHAQTTRRALCEFEYNPIRVFAGCLDGLEPPKYLSGHLEDCPWAPLSDWEADRD